MTWETVIGLEVHVQLLTKSKLFSGASISYGAEPNTQACAIDLGMPGVLPVLNQEAITMATKLGVSINATVNTRSVFARKNYFYPDLPKGYQISQYDLPIVSNGHLNIILDNGEIKKIGITRAHLEEDAGKSLHEAMPNTSGIDLNRAGTPLLEIVSEPDMRNAKEAVAYLKSLHSLVKYLGICDGNLQEGSFRCDANVSVRKVGAEKFGTRAELKNINSFKFVEKAINLEVERQIDILENGGTVVQETRLYDSDKNETRSMRSKEDAHDYRYFPDPDLLPVVISDKFITDIKNNLPELPNQKQERFIKQYNLSEYEATILASSKEMAKYFEETVKNADAKLSANLIIGELASYLNKNNLDISLSAISSAKLSSLVSRISDGTISKNIAKKVIEEMWNTGKSADEVIESQGLKQVSDSGEIIKVIEEIIKNNPSQVAEYRSGKDKLFGFFVGQVMKAMGGKANPAQLNDLLKKYLA
jgi:aspartyl-tRNA(Asn)/glutamyl-tRNA(Gln) amidotransferase subunit B